MKTGTKLLIGAGVVTAGAGIYLLSRPATASIKTTPPDGKVDDGGVFRLSAADTKAVACDLRAAASAADVQLVLGNLLEVVEDSGAEEVDLRSTGITQSKMSVAKFREEISTIQSTVQAVPGFLWGQAKDRIATMLSGLPACDAPMEQWDAMLGGGGVQAAMRRPPLTLRQAVATLTG